MSSHRTCSPNRPTGPAFCTSLIESITPCDRPDLQANFTLSAGSYVCGVIVRERATGRMFG